jgi:hypothetical protein
MSWRIENADAITVLRELPDGWAQTCVTSPPCGVASNRTLAVLTEVKRVLREDGSLWLFLPCEKLPSELNAAGWVEHRPPSWAAPLTLSSAGVRFLALLTKNPSYFRSSRSIAPRLPRGFASHRPGQHRQRFDQSRDVIRGLVGQCVLTTTTRVACGTCGAPYQREEPGERRSACVHHNPSGRCLVLDPFYRPGQGTLEAARYSGRNFLGITDSRRGERQ